MSTMTKQQATSFLFEEIEQGRNEFIINGEKKRVFKSTTGVLAYFKPRSRSKGYPLILFENVNNVIPFQPKQTEQSKKWENRVKRIIKTLDESGLWADVKARFEIMQLCGYEVSKRAYNYLYGENVILPSGDKVKALTGDLYVMWIQQQNSLVDEINSILKAHNRQDLVDRFNQAKKSEITEDYIKHYIPEVKEKMSRAIGMYNCQKFFSLFGYMENEDLKIITVHNDSMKHAIKNNIKYNSWGYEDESFEYDPETKRAWYTKYFKTRSDDYYIMLDDTHALFIERD